MRLNALRILRTLPERTAVAARHASTAQKDTRRDDLPKEADVVVIGAGAIGCSVAYHLSKTNVGKVVLLDKNDVASGTTWHTESLIWQLRPSDVDIAMIKHTMDLAKTLPTQTGKDVGLVQNGGLFIASRKERLDEYKRLHTIGKLFGVESEILSPPDVAQRFAQVHTGDIYGALFSPADGALDASSYCAALLHAAQATQKVSVVRQCTATNLLWTKNQYGRRVLTDVETQAGRIKTKVAVLCAGVWSGSVVRSLDMQLPQYSFFHTYGITEERDELLGMPNIRDHDGGISTKLHGKSLWVAGYEGNPTGVDEAQLAGQGASQLGSVNWATFQPLVDNAAKRVPLLKELALQRTVCGAEAFTPDHKPLMGETPELAGLYLCTGFNAGGIMYSGGCGRELAHWVVRGRPEADMSAYDSRRFNPAAIKNEAWVRERSHEAYVTNYSIVFRNDAPLAGRNLKKDALHSVLQSDGCVYQERYGWERPGWFSSHGDRAAVREYDFGGAYGYARHSDYLYAELLKAEKSFDLPQNFAAIKRECLACKTGAAMTNMSSRGKFFLVGPDSYRAADWLFSNNVPRAFGSVVHSLVLNKFAGIESDATVCVNAYDPLSLSFDRSIVTINELGYYRQEEQVLEPYYYYLTVDCAATGKFTDLANREIEAKNFNCSLLDATDSVCTILLQGPKSREILNLDVPNLQHKVVLLGDSVDRFKCRILQFARFGETAYELHVPSRDGRRLYNYLKRRGAMHNLVNAGYRGLDSLSIENCSQNVWRHNDTPFEAGLSSLCKLDSPKDFLGKAALLNQDQNDLSKRLLRVSLRKPVMLYGLETIYRDGKRVGFVRRADFGHASGKAFALGYIQKNLADATLSDEYLRSGRYQIERLGELIDTDVTVMSVPASWASK